MGRRPYAGEFMVLYIPCYLIFDHTLVDTYSFAGLPPGYTAGLAWVPQGKTLAELAQHLHLPAAAPTDLRRAVCAGDGGTR